MNKEWRYDSDTDEELELEAVPRGKICHFTKVGSHYGGYAVLMQSPPLADRSGASSSQSLVQLLARDPGPGFVESLGVPLNDQAAIQLLGSAHESAATVHDTAARGVAGASDPLPHADTIQQAFGKHDIRGIRAQIGGTAAEACTDIGASAYATGDSIAFASAPDLHTAAHEAAHVVQQRGGVQLKGGVGQAGDTYEQHADAVADRVVQGKSAEDLLDSVSVGSVGTRPSVQKCEASRAKDALHSPSTIADVTLKEKKFGKYGKGSVTFKVMRRNPRAYQHLGAGAERQVR